MVRLYGLKRFLGNKAGCCCCCFCESRLDFNISNISCFFFLVEVQSPSLGVPADPSQVDQPDQLHIWFLQLDIFFEKFFQAADHLEMIKRAQEKKS